MKKPEVNEPLLNRWIESIRSTGCSDEVQEVLFNCLPLISEYCIKDDYIKEYKSLQESLEFYNFIIPNVEVVLTLPEVTNEYFHYLLANLREKEMQYILESIED